MKSSLISCALISLALILFSLLYFAFNQRWLIVHVPSAKSASAHEQRKEMQTTKKRVKRFYWYNDAWHAEETDLLWSDDKACTLTHLITSWLVLLDEEKIMEKKVSLQSVVVCPSEHEAYISFDRNPFSKYQSTFTKCMWVEGLVKTIRENAIALQGIYLLVHHQPLTDFHLDFSNPWPLMGFVENA